MRAVVGIFPTNHKVDNTVERLRAVGVGSDQVDVLLGGDTPSIRSKSEIDSPAAGRAIWALTGGGIGVLAGVSLATISVPEGFLSAIGLVAIASLAALGALGGAIAGVTIESALESTPPSQRDEALEKRRNVVFVEAADPNQEDVILRVLLDEGGEALAADPDQWWVRLRHVPGPTPAPSG